MGTVDVKPSQPDVEIDFISYLNLGIRMTGMPKTFKIGDHVQRNSEAGRVSGVILKKVVSDPNSKAYVHHGSRETSLCLIKTTKPKTSQSSRVVFSG